MAVEQLVIDPSSRFLEMKSLQPYSTTDEYLYAMKEDLADWLSNMYPESGLITVDNFFPSLENGVLLCQHANNVNDAARKTLNSTLANCRYRLDARPQTFTARDNVSQFINWSRHVACVREVLMFESDDLILRKNEKNFILCLLEIARFGAKFGISVPSIIKLENEIEQEIERDKHTDKLSVIKYQYLQNENESHNFDKFIHNNGTDQIDNEVSYINHENFIEESILNAEILSNDDHKKQRRFSEESYDSLTSNEVNTTINLANNETKFNNNIEKLQNPIEPPASSSHLHKTVVQITNSCCCSQRFPVIRIGEGKYRIGEGGTIIFIRILRNHVMVRVGGGWDTLENYLNKHDPCRRSHAHRQTNNSTPHHHHHHHHHSDIPILAIPNTFASSNVHKNTPLSKSIKLKTEEFPLPKQTDHDTDLVNAQLVITRDEDGRHRIGQITYKAEDITNQSIQCPQHHHHHQQQQRPRQSSPMKLKVTRSVERSTPSPPTYNKQSSPSTDQDYSSYAETIPSKPSTSSSFDLKEDSIEQSTKPIENFMNKTFGITESIIDTIDGHIHLKSSQMTNDFDIRDIESVMEIKKKLNLDEDLTHMDNDSLESHDGILEEDKKSTELPLAPSKKTSSRCSAFYLAEKERFQKEQAANRKRSLTTNLRRTPSRSTILSNNTAIPKKDTSTLNKQRHQPIIMSKRSKSSDLIDKVNDMSKVDRDSGFDEQDFRRERLNSNFDDNSSISSIKSAKNSMNLEYKETKSYELRLKKLEAKRNQTEKNLLLKSPRHSSVTSLRRTSDVVSPIPPLEKYRKKSQTNVDVNKQIPANTSTAF